MAESKIKWTNYTYNRIIGCTEVSDECDNCYARLLNERHKWAHTTLDGVRVAAWGKGAPRHSASTGTKNAPLKWNRHAAEGRAAAEAKGTVWHRPRVFASSLSDVLDTEQDPKELGNLLDIVRICPELDWMLLTKRHNQLFRIGDYLGQVLPNLWLGVSAGRQKTWDLRVRALLHTPAAVHFVSVEPMLGPIDMAGLYPSLVICGGESIERPEQTARPMNPIWAQYLRDQCVENEVAFSFKQWGHYVVKDQNVEAVKAFQSFDKKNFHAASKVLNLDGTLAYPVGKKHSGHLLDGVAWEQPPTRWLDLPNESGWWHWRQGQSDRDTERLLIAANAKYAVVANDEAVATALGIEYNPDVEAGEPGSICNYWEMSPCNSMPGKWRLVEPFDFDN